MIPYSACMCFNRKGRPWTVTKTQKDSGVKCTVEDGKLVVTYSDREKSEEPRVKRQGEVCVHSNRPSCITTSEWSLLKLLETSGDTPRVTTRFLTPQRRRSRARIPVMKPKSFKSGLLDESYTAVVRSMLDDSNRWAFNTFHLDVVTGGRSLSVLLVHLFHSYGFIDTFKLDMVKVWRCFSLIESCYHSTNPYHNSVHAADVTQAMHCFLQQKKILSNISPLEAMAALLAAVTHDLDHPGVNQPFLIATSNHLASLYKNFSVLENHHWRMAISCLRESGIFDHLDTDTWDRIEGLIHSLILATDITRQQEFLSKFKRLLEADLLKLEDPLYRHFILQIALKCADLCNPCRPWLISQRWSHQVCLEFFKQGDFEKKLNLPLTPICDRTKTSIPKIQADFFRFVVTPLFEIWDKFLDSDLSRQLIDNLRYNQISWDGKVASIVNKPVPETEVKDDDDEEVGHLTSEKLRRTTETSSRVHRFNWVLRSTVEDDCGVSLWSRRCSMPLSMPKILSRTVLRRQSFPHAQWRANPDLTAYPIHRSPHMSLRTLSAEQLQPKTSIVSLSSSSGTAVSLLELFQQAEEVEKKLVHQPMSYPPFVSSRAVRETDLALVEESELGETPSDESRPLLVAEASSNTCRRKSGSSESDCSNGGGAGCSNRPPAENAQISNNNDTGNPPNKSGAQKEESRCERTDPPSTDSVLYLQSSEFVAVIDLDETSRGISRQRNSLKRSLAICKDSPDSSPVSRRVPSNDEDYSKLGVPRLLIEEDQLQPKSPICEEVSSWCSRVSESLSEERPEALSRDFDSPASSWKSSSSSLNANPRLLNRRGSAPVSLPSSEVPGIPSYTHPRRWSMATEAATSLGLSSERETPEDEIPSPTSILPLGKELVRRHSFGILESFVGLASSESENDGSSTDPTSTGTTCSTRRNSAVVRQGSVRDSFDSRCASVDHEGSCSSESQDIFPVRAQPSRNVLGRRRGSLPADIPISLTNRVHPFVTTTAMGAGTSGVARDAWSDATGIFGARTWGEYQSRRRASAGEILGAFVGQSSALASLREMSTRTPSPEQEINVWDRGRPSYGMISPRRASGGLELLGGLWRSNLAVGDNVPSPQAPFFAQIPKKRTFAYDQTDLNWLSSRLASRVPSSGFCGSKERVVSCQQRRGSVPVDLAL